MVLLLWTLQPVAQLLLPGQEKELKEFGKHWQEIGENRRRRTEFVRVLAGNEGKWRGLGGIGKEKKDVKENEGKWGEMCRKCEEIKEKLESKGIGQRRKGNQQHLWGNEVEMTWHGKEMKGNERTWKEMKGNGNNRKLPFEGCGAIKRQGWTPS